MFCSKCGAELLDDAKFCAECGNKLDDQVEANHPPVENSKSTTTSTTTPMWKKILIGVSLFIVGVVGLVLMSTSEMMDPVEAHLQALRNGDMESAHQHLSADFQSSMPLPAFKKYVAENSILKTHATFSMEESSFEGTQGMVTGYLLLNGEKFSRIEYQMLNTDGNWKIHGMNVITVLFYPVNNFLAALRGKNVEEAYRYTSQAFRSNTSLKAFNKFVASYPVLTQHTEYKASQYSQQVNGGSIVGYLLFNKKKAALIEVVLTKESDEWKIYHMQLKKPE
jgi:hypothetical protein